MEGDKIIIKYYTIKAEVKIIEENYYYWAKRKRLEIREWGKGEEIKDIGSELIDWII